MSRRLKRILIAVGSLVVAAASLAGYVYYTAFWHNRPIQDRQPLAPGVLVVKDGFVAPALLDVAPDRAALVDCGNDDSAKAVLAALADKHETAASVVAIFLTHGHGDHTHGCRVFSSAKVYALEAEVPTIGDAAHVDHPLHDGEVVEIGDLRVEAFATPGHTPGSAVYFARGVLFFGDSAGAAKDGSMMPAVRLFSKDPGQNVASLKALEARLAPRAGEVKVLDFAHSGPLEGFAPLAEFAQRH